VRMCRRSASFDHVGDPVIDMGGLDPANRHGPNRGSIRFAASHLSAPASGCEGLWHRNNSARVRIEAAGLIATTRRDLTDPHWRRERPIRLLPGSLASTVSQAHGKLMARRK